MLITLIKKETSLTNFILFWFCVSICVLCTLLLYVFILISLYFFLLFSIL